MFRLFRCLILPCFLISFLMLFLGACQLSAQPTLPQPKLAVSPSISINVLDDNIEGLSRADAQPSPDVLPDKATQVLPSPTLAPTLTPTASPTARPTAQPTQTPKTTPKPTPTKAPTPTPTKAPTPTPTAAPTGIQVHLPGVPDNWPISASQQSRVDRFIVLVNQARTAAGVAQLRTGGSSLREISAIRAAEISILFSHARPTADPLSDHWSDLLKAFKVSYGYAGENITGGPTSPESALTTFMNSEGHRNNILNPKFTTIAIGVYTDKTGKDWWAQAFTG